MLKFALLDDNKDLLALYETFIENINKKHKLDLKVVCCTTDIDEFLETVNDGLANTCLIDIDLGAGKNGLTVANQIRKEFSDFSLEIIFVTGHVEFMQESFRARPFNYLIKPVAEKNFEEEILRLYHSFTKNGKTEQDFINVSSKSTFYKFAKDDIAYLEYDYSNVIVHTMQSRIVLDNHISLVSIVDHLDPGVFIQSHRSIYVNKKYVIKVDFHENIIYLKNGQQCYMSRKYKKAWKDIFTKRPSLSNPIR